ncbi:G_PROTEIN_RECEP_F1_2 domain-containing protein [Meloidogyne graminicola]|uniref:G_PROTEIN_RECEP_F1_2 domain-containing protein n=1 Tax=Meloidogyne graminicola TaxID=189291 RepID=A0A8S9ZJW8_9BILA|nr:G_PROTEIN_RECEP_F1_2 domain-containing protein [Meloidogyne graminicola]
MNSSTINDTLLILLYSSEVNNSTNNSKLLDNYTNILCPKNAQSTTVFFILQFILPSITTFVGVTGNLLTIITIVISGLLKNYVNKYLIVLLASDSVLLLKVIAERIFKLGTRSYWVNFAGQYFWNVPIYVSNLTIILLTIERFFAVVFPIRHYKYTQFHRWKIIVVMLIFSLLANFNLLLVIRKKNPEFITKSNPFKYYYNNDLPLAKPLVLGPRILISFILPVFAVFLVNFTLVLKLRTRNIQSKILNKITFKRNI